MTSQAHHPSERSSSPSPTHIRPQTSNLIHQANGQPIHQVNQQQQINHGQMMHQAVHQMNQSPQHQMQPVMHQPAAHRPPMLHAQHIHHQQMHQPINHSPPHSQQHQSIGQTINQGQHDPYHLHHQSQLHHSPHSDVHHQSHNHPPHHSIHHAPNQLSSQSITSNRDREVESLRKTIEMLEKARLEDLKHTQSLEQQVLSLQQQLAINQSINQSMNQSIYQMYQQPVHQQQQHMASPHPQSPQTIVNPTSHQPAHQPSQSVTPPPHKKDEYEEPTQTANPIGRSSCHRCKSTKDNQLLMFCTYRCEESAGHSASHSKSKKKDCRKKYCQSCLKRSYGKDGHQPTHSANPTPASTSSNQSINQSINQLGDSYEWWTPLHRLGWLCPACLGCCKCAACQRKYAWDHSSDPSGAQPTNQSTNPLSALIDALQHQARDRMQELLSSGALSADHKELNQSIQQFNTQPVKVERKRQSSSSNSSSVKQESHQANHHSNNHATHNPIDLTNGSPSQTGSRSISNPSHGSINQLHHSASQQSVSSTSVSPPISHSSNNSGTQAITQSTAQSSLALLQALQSAPAGGDEQVEELKKSLTNQLFAYLSAVEEDSTNQSINQAYPQPTSQGYASSEGYQSGAESPGSSRSSYYSQSVGHPVNQLVNPMMHHYQGMPYPVKPVYQANGEPAYPSYGYPSEPVYQAQTINQPVNQSGKQSVLVEAPRRDRGRKRSTGGRDDPYQSINQSNHQQPGHYYPPPVHAHPVYQPVNNQNINPASLPRSASNGSINQSNTQSTNHSGRPSRENHTQLIHSIRDTLLRQKNQTNNQTNDQTSSQSGGQTSTQLSNQTSSSSDNQSRAIDPPFSPPFEPYSYDSANNPTGTQQYGRSEAPFSPVNYSRSYSSINRSPNQFRDDDQSDWSNNGSLLVSSINQSINQGISEESDVMPMLNSDSIGGSGRGLGVDDMQLSTLSLGAPPQLPTLTLSSDTFVPPTEDEQ